MYISAWKPTEQSVIAKEHQELQPQIALLDQQTRDAGQHEPCEPATGYSLAASDGQKMSARWSVRTGGPLEQVDDESEGRNESSEPARQSTGDECLLAILLIICL